MSAKADDYQTLTEETEQSETAFYFARWRYHLDEAKKIELKLAQRQVRSDSVEAEADSAPASKRRYRSEQTRTKGPKSSRSSSRRRFYMEGPTTVIVRLLYENRTGMTNFEMQARNGIAIKGRIIRKIVNRLVAVGCAIREGNKVVLTESGVAAWEASPLFLHSTRNNRDRAA